MKDEKNSRRGPVGEETHHGPEVPEGPVTPPPKLAELCYSDYSALEDQEAVDLVTDLGLMAPVDGAFGPDKPVSEAELAELAAKTAALMDGTAARALEGALGLPKDWGLTRIACARRLRDAMLAADGTGALPKLYYRVPVAPETGRMEFDHTLVFSDSCSAVENTGNSEVVFRNSRIIGATTAEAEPLKGPPAGLLIEGNLRTTLALKQSQAWYINSKVEAANWAGFSTDSGRPVQAEGQKELAVYVYGSDATVRDAGYGVYSDVFCNVFLYGANLQAAEIGIVSGTFGKFHTGNIRDGEACPALAAELTAHDRARQAEKERPTVVTAGRNAIMAHCVSLPPFWVYPGFSQEELPYHTAEATIRNTVLRTDASLDRHLTYPQEAAAYIRHHAGSVVLVKSCNVDFTFDNVRMEPDPRGTHALIHTAINSDIAFMVRVPEGQRHPGQKIRMRNMAVCGDILHEDYQRDLYLTLEDAALTGKIFTGTADTWNALAYEAGFPSFAIDPEGYHTVHGSHLYLTGSSRWTVTETSSLHELVLEDTAQIAPPEGKRLAMTVDGVPVALAAGHYQGDIRVTVS